MVATSIHLSHAILDRWLAYSAELIPIRTLLSFELSPAISVIFCRFPSAPIVLTMRALAQFSSGRKLPIVRKLPKFLILERIPHRLLHYKPPAGMAPRLCVMLAPALANFLNRTLLLNSFLRRRVLPLLRDDLCIKIE